MMMQFRNFGELGDAIGRLTSEEKSRPVRFIWGDCAEEIFTLGSLEIAGGEVTVPSGDSIDTGEPYLT